MLIPAPKMQVLFKQREPAFVLFFKQSTPPLRLLLQHLLHALVAERIESVTDPSSHSLANIRRLQISRARDDRYDFNIILVLNTA